jgi:GNAT superfamily N-acetyltransferase
VTRRTPVGEPTGPAIEVVPATADRWPDVMAIMGGSGGDRGCWCQYYRWSSSDFSALGAGGGRRALERQVTVGPPPGLLAYIDDQPVGWVGIGPRREMGRLVRSRTIPLIDDVPVWSILCFLVRPGFRRRGVTKALLRGAIAHARAAGAPGLEAYPIDSEGQRLDVALSYVGFTSTFAAAGFRRVIETAGKSAGRPRWLMRLDLDLEA